MAKKNKKSTKKATKAAPRKKTMAAAMKKAVKKAVKKVRKAVPARKAAPRKKAAARPRAAARPAAAAPQPKGLAPGMPWISPHLTVRDVESALDFYKRGFGFQERFRMPGPGGQVVHAEVVHQSGVIMLGPEDPARGNKAPSALGGTPAGMYVYCDDVDALHARATAAGAQSTMPPTDMFWGDRCCRLVDPEGHSWMFSTFKRMVGPKEIEAAMKAQQAQAPPQGM